VIGHSIVEGVKLSLSRVECVALRCAVVTCIAVLACLLVWSIV
jgi:hypothetical protein